MNSNGRIGYQLKMYVHFVFKYWQFLYYLYDPRFGRDGWLTSNEVDNGWALVTLFAKPMIQHYGTWLPNDYIMRSHILPYLIICSSWIKHSFVYSLANYLQVLFKKNFVQIFFNVFIFHVQRWTFDFPLQCLVLSMFSVLFLFITIHCHLYLYLQFLVIGNVFSYI